VRSFTAADLETLARGRRVEPDVFQAIMADAEAVGELARLRQVQELLDPETEAPRAAEVPVMDVSWDELAAYGEGKQLAPARCQAVERFLGAHFPAALRDAAGSDTCVNLRSDEDTELPVPKGKAPEPRRPERHGGA
jgi:hypothetical protein